MATTAAVYENGVLRPLSPLPFAEGTRVQVTVMESKSAPSDVGDKRDTFAASQPSGESSVHTGAELARVWRTLPHLSAEEAAEFERDLAEARAAERGQVAPAWE